MGRPFGVFVALKPDRFTLAGRFKSALRSAVWTVFRPTPRGIVQDLMDAYGVPALALAIAKSGTIVFSEGFGVANPQANERVTADSLFRIASNSKAITAAAIHLLAERGALALSDRVFGAAGILGTTYGTKPYTNWLEQIEVRHLLGHLAGGWPNDGNDPMFQSPQLGHSALIGTILDADLLTRPPGVAYMYSNFGYCLLGRIIERKTGQSYENFVRHEVLIPAGAHAMRLAGDTVAERAPGEVVYTSAGGGSPYGQPVRRMDAHGGWISSAPDYVRFLMAIDMPPAPPDLLAAASVTAMRTASAESGASRYGHGVVTDGTNIWHNGMLRGSRSVMWGGTGGNAWCAVCTGGPEPGSKGKKSGDPLLAALDKMMWKLWDLV